MDGAFAPRQWQRARHIIDVVYDAQATPAKNGIGTATTSRWHRHRRAAAALREDLVRRGVQVTPGPRPPVLQIEYFREPGAFSSRSRRWVPASRGRGLRNLGRDLKLPPWEEPHRQEIENRLRRLHSLGSFVRKSGARRVNRTEVSIEISLPPQDAIPSAPTRSSPSLHGVRGRVCARNQDRIDP